MKKRITVFIGAICFLTASLCAQDLDALSLKKGITASGGLSFSNTFYSGNSQIVHRDPYLYFLTGNLNINMFGFDLPFSFSYSNTSKSYMQPFNRFEFAPKYKWVKMYFGSTAMNFSKYTLAGHRFTGVGAELTPGNWYIGAMYGRLLKPVEYDPQIENLTAVSYKRMGYGVKAGYSNNGDEASVIFFTARDHTGSLKYAVPDEANLHPQENTTISASGKKSFLKYFFVQAEYAFSIYNSELRNEMGEKPETSNFVDNLLGKNGNDRYLDALNASVGFQNPLWGLSLGYERVAPDYQTLGGYYFTNDVEIFKAAPNVNLWKGKLRLSGSIGLEYNNLDNKKANDTRRTVGSANLAFTPSEAWNATLGYSNFTTYTKYRPQAYPYYVDNLDSLNFYQVTQTLNASLGYVFGEKERIMNTVMTTASYQTGGSRSGNLTGDRSEFLSLMLSFGEQFIPQNLTWSAFMSVNNMEATGIHSLFWGPGTSLSKGFLKNSLTGSLTCNYNQSKMSGMVSSSTSLLNTSLALQYTLQGESYGKHSISANAGLTSYFNNEQTYEFLAMVMYGVKF